MFPIAGDDKLRVLLERFAISILSRSHAVLKSRISAACLLALCLCGCPESTEKSKSERTGSVGGVTSQDIDDLGKPASPAKNPN